MASPQKRKTLEPQGGLFRILIGDHIDNGPAGCECEDCLRTGGKDHRYRARRFTPQGEPVDPPDYDNDLIESRSELTRMNAGPNSRKFERIHQTAPMRETASSSSGSEFRPPSPGLTGQEPRVEPTSPPPLPENFETWSRKQLEALAADRGVDLVNARSRDEIVRAIRGG